MNVQVGIYYYYYHSLISFFSSLLTWQQDPYGPSIAILQIVSRVIRLWKMEWKKVKRNKIVSTKKCFIMEKINKLSIFN